MAEAGSLQAVDRFRGPGCVVARGAQGTTTLSELLADVAGCAGVLRASGQAAALLVSESDRYEFAVQMLAAWELGWRVVLAPTDAPEGVRSVAHSESALVLTTPWRSSALSTPTLKSFRSHPPERTLVVLYTSGTGGDARPMTKTAGQLLGEAAVIRDTFGIQPGTRVLGTVAPRHIYGLLFTVLVPLGSGGSFVRVAPFHPNAVAAQLEEADVLVTVPAHLQALCVLSDLTAPRCHVFSSGAPLPPTVARELDSRHHMQVTEVLGSTETGGIAYRRASPREPFLPLPGVVWDVDDDGTLLIDSPFLPPDCPRPYSCADKVRADGNGFEHLGRLDDVVKVGGIRVAVGDVRDLLLAHPDVVDAAVFAEAGSPLRTASLSAFVVVRDGLGDLRGYLGQHLQRSVIPRIHVVDELPRTELGKVRRADLEDTTQIPITPLPSEGDCRWYDVHVPANLLYFRGHFEGFPILPGVVQLQRIVARQIRDAWPEFGPLHEVHRLKFKRPIGPDDRLVLSLEIARPNQVAFRLLMGEEVCSSGTLVFGEFP